MDKIEELLTRRVEKIYPNKRSLEKVLRSGKKLRLYLGVEPTGINLHLGHVIPLLKLKEFMDLGHEVIFLVGDFTALCGDPSGHEDTRKGLTPTQISKNMVSYQKQASAILDFSKAKVKHNKDWLAKLTLSEVIELASHFTVQQNIERDLFQRRIAKEKPIYLHEFFYPILQGYDSVAMNVDLEIGGTDQTFNMLAGRTLQKIYHQKEKFVLTVKMMLGTDGKTMSKTSGNTINILDSPKDKYGKVMSIIDEMIPHYFEFATNLPLKVTKEYDTGLKSGHLNPMIAKKKLAWEITKMYHGIQEADQAQREFESIFQKKKLPANIKTFRAKVGDYYFQVLFQAGIASSNSMAKRLIREGSFSLNQQILKDHQLRIKENDDDGIIKVGSKNFLRLKVN